MVYTASAAFSPRGSALGFALNASLGFTTLAELMEMSFSGTKLDLADVTNFQGGIFKEWLATLLDSGELTFKGNFIPGDATQQNVLVYFNNGTRLSWYLTLPNNPATGLPYGHFTFLGFVAEYTWGLPISKQGEITGKVKITGAITFVAGS